MKPPSERKTNSKPLKWLAGAGLTLLLFWQIWVAARPGWAQLQAGKSLIQPDLYGLVILAAWLLPVNLLLDARRWQILARTTQTLTLGTALGSVLAGLAAGFITPNRLGEYPARIWYLRLSQSARLVSVSLLGMVAQIAATLAGGLAGVVYFCFYEKTWWGWPALAGTLIVLVVLLLVYFRFDRWAPRLEKLRWLKKWELHGARNPLTPGERWQVLLLSLLRFLTYSLQYYLLLQWLGVGQEATAATLFLRCLFFFWAMTVIPTIALAELGIRGGLGLFLFLPTGGNSIAILLATLLLWLYNLVLPTLPGAWLIWREKLLINREVSAERNGI